MLCQSPPDPAFQKKCERSSSVPVGGVASGGVGSSKARASVGGAASVGTGVGLDAPETIVATGDSVASGIPGCAAGVGREANATTATAVSTTAPTRPVVKRSLG